MNLIKISLTSIILNVFFLYAPLVNAEDKKSISLGIYQIAYTEPGVPTLNPTMISLQGNYPLWKGFSIDARVAHSLNTSRVSSGDDEFLVDASLISGLYVKYNALNYGRFSPYVIAGATYGEIEFTQIKTDGVQTINNVAYGEDSFSYGFGADIKINNKLSINLGYMNYFDARVFEVTATAINLVYRF